MSIYSSWSSWCSNWYVNIIIIYTTTTTTIVIITTITTITTTTIYQYKTIYNISINIYPIIKITMYKCSSIYLLYI